MKTLLSISFAALAVELAFAQSDWKVGRATFYGTDGWSIHQGSCGFYYIFEVCLTLMLQLCFVLRTLALIRRVEQDSPLGWDVAAMTDVNPLYTGSCGYGSQYLFDVNRPSFMCTDFVVQVLF